MTQEITNEKQSSFLGSNGSVADRCVRRGSDVYHRRSGSQEHMGRGDGQLARLPLGLDWHPTGRAVNHLLFLARVGPA